MNQLQFEKNEITWKKRYLSLPYTRQNLTQGQWPKGRIKVRIRGREGRARAEARTLLDFAGHRLTLCNVSLMSLAGHGPDHGFRYECLIIAWTGQRGPVLYLLVNDRLRGQKKREAMQKEITWKRHPYLIKRNPTNVNAKKFMKAQRALTKHTTTKN